MATLDPTLPGGHGHSQVAVYGRAPQPSVAGAALSVLGGAQALGSLAVSMKGGAGLAALVGAATSTGRLTDALSVGGGTALLSNSVSLSAGAQQILGVGRGVVQTGNVSMLGGAKALGFVAAAPFHSVSVKGAAAPVSGGGTHRPIVAEALSDAMASVRGGVHLPEGLSTTTVPMRVESYTLAELNAPVSTKAEIVGGRLSMDGGKSAIELVGVKHLDHGK